MIVGRIFHRGVACVMGSVLLLLACQCRGHGREAAEAGPPPEPGAPRGSQPPITSAANRPVEPASAIDEAGTRLAAEVDSAYAELERIAAPASGSGDSQADIENLHDAVLPRWRRLVQAVEVEKTMSHPPVVMELLERIEAVATDVVSGLELCMGANDEAYDKASIAPVKSRRDDVMDRATMFSILHGMCGGSTMTTSKESHQEYADFLRALRDR